ncbi:MAG TPA: hypothetical protein VM889_00460 [Candidatus Thermoplasmatota archaeon]|nr:hypothetical protein [Candidatus Thermoplasmatota archaeon]
MAACASCGQGLEGWMSFCPACGARAKPSPAPSPVFLEDVIAACVQCGAEHPYGKLVRCSVCHERSCSGCSAACRVCGETSCLADVLDCSECGKPGCAACYLRCESCGTRAMCPDDDAGCSDCGLATCGPCMKHCGKCDLDVCEVCLDEAHEEAKGSKRRR